MKSNYYITYQKEWVDSLALSSIIKTDDWVDQSLSIVTCSPDYSSITTQILNHKLSHLNENELFEQLFMEMPYPTMSQVWNKEADEYQHYDKYIIDWMGRYIRTNRKYLFVDSAVIRGKNFSQLKTAIKTRISPDNYRFACLYKEKSSIFIPSYYVEEYDSNVKGHVLFEWENMNNPNWNGY